jgi:hypothetical protein
MAQQQQPVGISSPGGINGLKTDWSSVRTTLFGAGLTASHMKDFSWKETVTPTKPRGVHGIPLRSGLGFYAATASATITLEAWTNLLTVLPAGYTALLDTISVSYQPYGADIIGQAKIYEARIIGVDKTWSQGQGDGLWVKLDLDVRYCEEAGPDGVFKCAYPINLDGR